LSRAADAVVLGFSKAPLLIERSLAPLRRLKQEGVLRNIHYVTWDSADIDPHAAPIQAMPEVTMTRVPQPVAEGTPYQKTIVYQIRNLEAALALIPEDDTIVLKSRPDFVADVDFLRDKIENFDLDCEIESAPAPHGVEMPKPIFRSKIWTPWADASQPFFYEDAAFLGRKDDLLHLTLPVSRADLGMLEMEPCYHYYHIVRFAKAFLPAYPMFKRYLKNFHHITNNMQYRAEMLRHAVKNPYFLFLMIAHAWILHSHFQVDCGEQGDLQFFPNTRNKDADWSNPATWNLAFPYDDIGKWRKTEFPGKLLFNITRPFGRLMDDQWQNALFTREISDLPQPTLKGMLEHVAHSRDGRLKKLERDFYDDLASFYRTYMKAHPEGFIRPADPPTRAAALAQLSATPANP
jgi:hypothetical protein